MPKIVTASASWQVALCKPWPHTQPCSLRQHRRGGPFSYIHTLLRYINDNIENGWFCPLIDYFTDFDLNEIKIFFNVPKWGKKEKKKTDSQYSPNYVSVTELIDDIRYLHLHLVKQRPSVTINTIVNSTRSTFKKARGLVFYHGPLYSIACNT